MIAFHPLDHPAAQVLHIHHQRHKLTIDIRHLWDDISTIKTTYRLHRLAPLLLIMQTAWPTGDAPSQRCWHSSCLMISVLTLHIYLPTKECLSGQRTEPPLKKAH
jgi:hypothetical protein